jgi:LuxR family transcriptional regulator, regulator of acetate metabolism
MSSATVDPVLARRLQEATGQARELLGATSDDLHSLIVALSERLAVEQPADTERALAEHQAALGRLRQRFEARFGALARAQASVSELREITSPASMLQRAPASLCGGSELCRAFVSLVRGGQMIVESVHFDGDADAAKRVLAQLRAAPVRLEHPLIETELLRRRRATIVLDAHVHPRVDRRLTEVMGWRTYVAAPIVAGSQVTGVIHADRGPDQQLDVLDRDVLWEFTSGLAQAYESASLRRTLRHERDQMREFLQWLGARSSELSDAPVTLARGADAQLAPEGRAFIADDLALGEGRDDRAVFEGLLTRRELDVLRLLAEGKSNKAIADELVVSTGTIKFHVNSLLRKLHVANRAEAVARYLRLLGMRTP